jgi:hypothetical protein
MSSASLPENSRRWPSEARGGTACADRSPFPMPPARARCADALTPAPNWIWPSCWCLARCFSGICTSRWLAALAPRLHQLAPSSADLVGRFAKFFRDGRPGGSLPAFASSYVATRIQAVTAWLLLSPPSSLPSARFTARLPSREQYGLTVFRMCDRNGTGPSSCTDGVYAHDG